MAVSGRPSARRLAGADAVGEHRRRLGGVGEPPRSGGHKVVPQGHVKIVLFEPAGIAHTGNVRAEITRDRFDRLVP